jgi:hypothetical protein
MLQMGLNQTGTNLLEWRDATGTTLLGGIDDAGNFFVNGNTTSPAVTVSNSGGGAGIRIDNSGAATPGNALEVVDGGGGVKLSYGTVTVVGDAATIPDGVTVVEITSDNNNTNDNITLPAGQDGMILYVRYVVTGALDNAVFLGVLPGPGLVDYTTTQSAHLTFAYIGGAWRLMSVVE